MDTTEITLDDDLPDEFLDNVEQPASGRQWNGWDEKTELSLDELFIRRGRRRGRWVGRRVFFTLLSGGFFELCLVTATGPDS